MLLGGLLLLRNGTSWRTPTLVILSSLVCLVTLRLPIVVTSAGAVYRWLPLRTPGVSWETMTTFALYELAAGPLVFTAFFLAPAGASSPTSRTGQTAYALLLGAGSAAGQLYISVPAGPLLALAVVSLLSPLIDRAFRPRPVL
jgi:Na+-translocating ferredoxin:NAD+ oxidoreductase RnfD subunit